MYSLYYIYNDLELLYIGHTKNFHNRKKSHKSCCYNVKDKNYNLPLYKHIRDNNIDWNTLEFIQEPMEIMCKKNIKDWEAFRIKTLYPLLNKEIPLGSYIYDNTKTWKYNHTKRWREENKEHYDDINRIRTSKYYHEHKDEINERRRQKYHQNKDAINEKRRMAYKSKNNDSV